MEGFTTEEDDFTSGQSSNDEEAFRSTLELVLSDVYPILIERLQRANWAGWHRRQGQIDDLAQEAYFQLHQHCVRNRFHPERPLNYMVVIARNLAKRQYADSRRKPLDIAQPIADNLPDLPVENADSKTQRALQFDRIQQVIDQLPPRQRQSFELRLANPGATDRELGEQIGITEDGFRKNSDRAYRRLKKILVGDDCK